LAEVAELLDAHLRPSAARRAFRDLVTMVEMLADAELAAVFASTTADQSSLADPIKPQAA
jgi:hypothetical protein